VQPCTTWNGDLEELLDTLGEQGVLQLLVEGGPTIASAFHDRNLIDRYVFHIAPIVSGDTDALGVFPLSLSPHMTMTLK
jgi:diaminohydroxyphosphoribosylaminopyrimidine deaminase/5-amino-6-(5-phosphoribosylamino)uracil reductase